MGASGSSTAMFAASVRSPSKGLTLIRGEFPVAMTTIMVSPMALPKPTMSAEKIPLAAVGRITRAVVCQTEAPQASDPALSDPGTVIQYQMMVYGKPK